MSWDLAFDDDMDGSRGRAVQRARFGEWSRGVSEDSMPNARLDVRAVTIERTNGHGFKTADGWLNFSRFARPEDIVMPAVGDHVMVHLDRSGFVRKVDVVAPAIEPEPDPVATPVVPAPSVAPVDETVSADVITLPGRIQQDDRGTTITRMNVLSTATAILASGGRATDAEAVIQLASRLEQWIIR